LAIHTVEWSSFAKLSCSGCTPADVFLCTTFDFILPARLTRTTQSRIGNQVVYKYTFTYDIDDDQFPGFTCANISGALCRGCMTDFVVQSIAAAVSVLPPPATFLNQVAYTESNDFLLNPDTGVNINLFATNPSSLASMEAQIHWGWMQRVSTTGPIDFTSIAGQVSIDGNPIPNFAGQDVGVQILGGPTVITTSASGAHSFVLNSGQTSIVTLALTPVHGAALPDTAWLGQHMYLSAYGVSG
jgi:hypothetical protein